jgi:hypothetical protein
MPLAGTGTISDAWLQARQRVGRSTIAGAAIALTGGLVTFVLLDRLDVGTIVVQVVVAVIVVAAVFLARLVLAVGRLEHDLEQSRRDFAVLQQRGGVANTMRSIAAACREDLDRPSEGDEQDQKLLERHVRRALDAGQSDRYVNVDRIRELEHLVESSSPDVARQRVEELEQLLRNNVYEDIYLRP